MNEIKLNKRKIIDVCLERFGYVDLIARGQSMYPTIKDGEHIRVLKCDDFIVGDIVAYWNDNSEKIIVHKIVFMHNEKIFTKGDNNPEIDKVVKQTQILGKVNLMKKIQ